MSEAFEKNEMFEVQMFHEGDHAWVDAFSRIATWEEAQKVMDYYQEDKGFLRIVRTTIIREVVTDE